MSMRNVSPYDLANFYFLFLQISCYCNFLVQKKKKEGKNILRVARLDQFRYRILPLLVFF